MPDQTDHIPIRPDGLQLEDHRGLQNRVWIWQRIGWLCFVAIVALAVAGGTGRGGIWGQRAVAVEGGAMVMPRVSRRGASEEMRITFDSASGLHEVSLGADFLDVFQISSISPDPERAFTRGGAVVLHLAANGPAPHVMIMSLRARRAGIPYISLALDGAALRTRAIILP